MIKPIVIPSELGLNPRLKSPIFYAKMPDQEVALSDPRALRALVAIMDMHAVIGGAASHFGGPSAFAEIVSALYARVFSEAREKNKNWFDLYNLVNDAGHCENVHYAIKANYGFADLTFEDLWRFRSIESPLTGHGEAHLFPQGVLLSNGPLGSGFPQSQGLALGDCLAGRNRTTITLISDGAMMEGEAKEALSAIPGLALKNKLAPYVLIISDNNTKLSGRIDEDSYSLEPTFESLSNLGWQVVKLEQGHNLELCYQNISSCIEMARSNPAKPVALWIKTIKGYGHSPSEKSASGGHGFPLKSASELLGFLTSIFAPAEVPKEFQDWANQALARESQIRESKNGTSSSLDVQTEKVQVGVSKALIAAAEKGLPIVSVTSDLPGSTGVAGFRKAFPEQSIDVGVAEANMISTAAGLAKTGFIPVVDTFAQFGVTKGALPLLMSSLSKAPVIGIFSHIGFQDAADGASHQSLNYLAFTLGIPHVEVWSLASSEEAESLISQAIAEYHSLVSLGKTPPSYLFFLGRENFPVTYAEGAHYRLRSHQLYTQVTSSGTQALVVAMGSLIPQALEAANILQKEEIGVDVIHPGFLTSPDISMLKPLLEKVGGRVVFVEDHQKTGGFAEHWISCLLQSGVSLKPKVLGVAGHFGQSAYEAQELYARHGLSADQIVTEVKNLIG